MNYDNGYIRTGPLRVSPNTHRYFTDGSGKAIYLTGSHTWANFQDIGTLTARPFDYGAYLDFIERFNHNFIRLWVWEQAAWAPWTEDKILFEPSLYQRTGPGKALDGGLKFDLTRFNPAYFDRLRHRVVAARTRGIYVSVMLFQGFSIETKGWIRGNWLEKKILYMLARLNIHTKRFHPNNPWRGHPYNIANNINGIKGDLNGNVEGKEVHSLSSPTTTTLQKEYLQKVLDTLNDLDNVMYEISNESYVGSADWQNHMVKYIHDYEAEKPSQHPVLLTHLFPGGTNSILFNSSAEGISPCSTGGFKKDPPPADGSKIIIADTDHFWGVGGDRKWVWKSFLRGLNPIFMDPYTDQAQWVDVRKNLGYTLTYANRVDLINMVPRVDLSSTGYCLAKEGTEYLVYFPSGGRATVDLSATPKQLSVEWFNPYSGKITISGKISGGENRTFTTPFDGDSVLYAYNSNLIAHN